MCVTDTRNLAKLRAALRAEFALKQKLERIDWEYDTLRQRLAEFSGRAAQPELPADIGISVVTDREVTAQRARRPRNPRA